MQGATIKLDSDPAKNNKRSLKLRIGYKRDRRRYAFPRPILLDDKEYKRLVNFHETKNARISEEIRLLYNQDVKPFIDKAEKILSELDRFDFDLLRHNLYKEEWIKEEVDENNVIQALERKAELMRNESRLGNAVNYELAGKSLQRFINSFGKEELSEFLGIHRVPGKIQDDTNRILRFEQATPDFIKLYEHWMLSEGKKPQSAQGKPTGASITTVGIYLRHLRSVYNDAIDSGIVDRAHYPFRRNGYVIPAGTNTKKALAREGILKIVSFECEPGSLQERSRDFWVFSYLSNGLNFKDMLMLKWRNYDIEKSQIVFVREKTSRTKRGNQMQVRVYLHPIAIQIIDRWAGESKQPDDYIFRILKKIVIVDKKSRAMTPEEQKQAVAQCIKLTNKYMRLIGDSLGIKGDLRTYAARHSFATSLLLSEAPLAFIKESLGHSSLKTTESYLASFGSEEAKKYTDNLL